MSREGEYMCDNVRTYLLDGQGQDEMKSDDLRSVD